MQTLSWETAKSLTRLVVTAGLVLSLPGCVKERSTTGRRLVVPEGEAYEHVERLEETPGAPLVRQTSLSTSFSLVGLGEVEYDGFTLPIVQPSSNAHRVAVQDGARPSWSALLAKSRTGAAASSVSLYELDPESDPLLIVQHPGPLILGRTSNEKGVLVERPNPDGSRWIGLAPWDGTAINWIVSDTFVNAYAWIAPDGTLAYARQNKTNDRFRLVIMLPENVTWELPESLPYSWILPTIDSEGTGLFAMRLGDGYADLAWGRLEYAAMFRQTLCVHRVSNRIDTKRAWQMLAGSTGSAGQAPGVLLWFSFELGRLVGWQAPQSRTFLMPKGSVAGFALGKKDNWLVTTTELLQLVVFIQGSSVQTTLFDTPWIARGGSPKNQVIVHATGSKLILAELETNATAEEE